ncbi:hypothetical protein RJ640_028600 [Escallonia rubra]|uniref:Uncharacterized protein n=1 Tax=Escallonia rubra TaxID=112253 RepID=A0AA88R3J4_9ASTE|nr:hypothetical protein RJ640_028600 [Escallonia rubra]
MISSNGASSQCCADRDSNVTVTLPENSGTTDLPHRGDLPITTHRRKLLHLMYRPAFSYVSQGLYPRYIIFFVQSTVMIAGLRDIYSFGMMLLEMVGGRKNTDATVQNGSQAYFPEWVYNRLCEGEELWIKADEEEHGLIAKRLTIIGLWCIQWYPMGRPSMKIVVQMLEGKGDTLSMPPNPFDSTKPARVLDNELPIIF